MIRLGVQIWIQGSVPGSEDSIFFYLDPTLIRNNKKYIYIMYIHIKFEFINHNFKLEYVHSGLYFVLDENNLICPLLVFM